MIPTGSLVRISTVRHPVQLGFGLGIVMGPQEGSFRAYEVLWSTGKKCAVYDGYLEVVS